MLQLKDSLSGEDQDDASLPAIGLKCISCGGGFAGGSKNSLASDASSAGSSILPDSLGDYEQFVQVLNRSAGLKPLGRITVPDLPKTAFVKTRKEAAQEPLYRKAKMAAQLKEIPKIPLMSMSHSSSTPEQIFQMSQNDDDDNSTLATSVASTRTKQSTVGLLRHH